MKIKGNKNWIDDNTHLAISGNTGSGKTTLMNELYSETDRVAIAIDTLKIGRFRGHEATSVQQVIQHLHRGRTRIVFKPHYDSSQAQDQLHKILNELYDLHGKNSNLKFLLAIDECHNFGRTHQTDSPLARAVKEGRNKNIKVVGTSQEPQKVNNSMYSQAYLIWAGSVPRWGYDYLENKHIPVSELEQQEQYHFSVYNTNASKISEGITSSDY